MSNGFGGNGVYLARFFQVAYVTRDLDRAVGTFQERYAVRSFQFMRGNRFDAATTLDIAVAWVGEVMIELIQPQGNGGSIYELLLGSEEGATRLHHLGHLVAERDEWTRLLDTLRRGKHPIVAQGSLPDVLDYVYVDARNETGHYLEYIQCGPAGQALFEGVPRS